MSSSFLFIILKRVCLSSLISIFVSTKDLHKALNVAKEIENAKVLIEENHTKSNHQNYEVLKTDKKKKGPEE